MSKLRLIDKRTRKTGRGRTRILWVFLLLPVLFVTGCAYFNTFYHAKKYYKQAEATREREEITGKTTGSASNLYKQSIEKCKRVIDLYPGSKWEDDAHLLMAKGYYGQADYLTAEQTLRPFPQKFPDSKLVPEAAFWMGLIAFAQEDYSDSRRIWGSLLQEFPDFEDRQEVEFYLAQGQWQRGEVDEAILAYDRFLEKYPRGDWAANARLDLGDLLMEEKRYEKAAEVFGQVVAKGKEKDDRLEARLLLGKALEAQQLNEEALEVYTRLELMIDPDVYAGRVDSDERETLLRVQRASAQVARQDSLLEARFQNPGETPEDTTQTVVETPDETPPFLPEAGKSAPKPTIKNRNPDDPKDRRLGQVMLREGAVLGKLDRPWDAILVFEQIVGEYPRSVFAAEAQYRIGYTLEVLLEDFEQAQKAYADVSKHGLSSFREEADRRAKNLNTVKALLATAATDSLSRAISAAVEARFMRAELYLFQQEDAERALNEYREIETRFPGTPHAAKAGLAIAWVTQSELGDSTGAMTKYREVAEHYQGTEYGRQAAQIVYGPESDPDPEEFTGPSIEELRSPENLAVLEALREQEDAAADSLVMPPTLPRNPQPDLDPGDPGSLSDIIKRSKLNPEPEAPVQEEAPVAVPVPAGESPVDSTSVSPDTTGASGNEENQPAEADTTGASEDGENQPAEEDTTASKDGR